MGRLTFNWRRVTKHALIALVAVVVVYDVYVILVGGPEASISRVTRDWAMHWQAVPFGVGIVTGHLFWPELGVIRYKWERISLLWLVGLAVLITDIAWVETLHPAWPFVAGILLGRALWPQRLPRRL